jgi:hypothetical protein
MRYPVLLALAVAAAGAAPPEFQAPTFREAARDAQSVVRVRVVEQSAVTFNVVEIIRGHDVPKQIHVASELWAVHRPKPVPEGEVTYLVLLGSGEQLLCGHANGLIVLSHTCIGIVPVIGGRIPAEYASRYDRDATGAVELSQVHKDLGKPK